MLTGIFWTIFTADEGDHPLGQFLPLVLMTTISIAISLILLFCFNPLAKLTRLAKKRKFEALLEYSDKLDTVNYEIDEKAYVLIHRMTAQHALGRIEEAKETYGILFGLQDQNDAIRQILSSWENVFQ